ncbi:MAG: HU family DNA-binding protein [Rikenellaceae bacterium]|nr:HU family DNA-binding protein [Rikenellaceae bacterium]
MNKTQLVEAMAQDAGITKTEAKKVLNSFLKVTTQALSKGDKLTLVGFGTFTAADKPARAGRNPRTGDPIQIDAKNSVKFKPGMDLLDAVKK